MTRKEMKLKVKNELKAQAKEIRELKRKRKDVMYGYVHGLGFASEDYRYKHVAYCTFFNNTPYDLVESNPREPLEEGDYEGFTSTWKKEIVNVKIIHTSS